MHDFELVRAALRSFAAPPRCVQVARGEAALGEGSFRGIAQRPTLILCLSGRADYQITGTGRAQDLQLCSGEILAIRRGAAFSVRPRHNYRSLLVGVGEDHIHGHIAVHRRDPGLPPTTWPRLAHAARIMLARPPSQALRSATDALFACLEDHDLATSVLIQAQIVIEVLCVELSRPAAAGHAASRRRFHAAKAHVDEHFTGEVDRDEVAAVIGVDPAHVSRLFRRYAGCTFNAYLWRRRIDAAKDLLRDPRRTVGAVAAACGCPDANYFARRFSSSTGLSPTAWATRSGS